MNDKLAHQVVFHQHSIGVPLSSPLFKRRPEFTRERCARGSKGPLWYARSGRVLVWRYLEHTLLTDVELSREGDVPTCRAVPALEDALTVVRNLLACSDAAPAAVMEAAATTLSPVLSELDAWATRTLADPRALSDAQVCASLPSP